MTQLHTRNALVQRIVRLVSEGSSVEIVGTRWSGRTELLERINTVLASMGSTVLTVRGMGSGLPLESIRAALPPGTFAPGRDGGMPHSVINQLALFLEEGPAVILLDDGDLLDEASWTVLETVHKRTGTPIIGVTLQRANVSVDDNLLIKVAHPVVKITLDEIKVESLQELLEDRLGGAVAPSAIGRIHTKSGGIPGFAIAITDAALAHGQLRKDGVVWRDEPDLWSDDLNGAYEALLFSYSDDVREALELLALVGSVPVEQATQLVGREMLRTLEGDGLARLFVTGSRHLIGVRPPGLGDYFRERPLTTHRMRLLAQVEQVMGVSFPTTPLTDSRTEFTGVSHRELPLIARMFSDQYRTEAALSWNDWERTLHAAEAVRVLGVQLTGPASAEQLWEVVERTDLANADPVVELEFRFLHARWLTVNERPFDEIEAVMRPGPRFPHADALSALLEGLRFERFGIPVDFEDVLAAPAQAQGLSGEVGRVVLASVRVLAGESESALELLELFGEGFVAAGAKVMRGLALLSSGRISEALEWATEHVEASIVDADRSALAGHSYIAALSLLASGRLDEAAEAGHIVTTAGVSAAGMLFAPDKALLLALAVSATRTGRTLTAQGLIQRAERCLGRTSALPLGDGSVVEAMMVAAEGELPAAAKSFHRTADELSDKGFRLAADGIRLLAHLSDFDPEQARGFRARAEQIGGRLFAGYLDAREAIHNQDPAALCEAARVLKAENATDEALKHLSYAATIYRERGMLDEAALVRLEILALTSEGTVTAWATSRAESRWGLTSRERQIVDDVAAGKSNRQIAADHSISVRTIESHLRNIRRKTGALSRDEIADFG